MKRALAAGLALAPLLLASPSHADDQDHLDAAERAYLAEIEQSGVPVKPPTGALQAGHWACDDLRLGMSPQEVIATHFGVFDAVWGPAVVAAAQHHLCPDTLTQGG